jgi:magnesium-transporting ATPase (P-type)
MPSSERRMYKDYSVKSNISALRDEKVIELEKYNIKNLNRIANTPNSLICVSGKAFSFILQKNKYYKEGENRLDYHGLLRTIDEKAIIFYRMNPYDKVDLVNFFKENKQSIVTMCGDGANDCGALLSADVGISLNNKNVNHNITAHFYSADESIQCVELVLKNGRACYENSIIVFKFMMIYATIQLTSCLLLYSNGNRDFNNSQYLFVDFCIVFLSSLLLSK